MLEFALGRFTSTASPHRLAVSQALALSPDGYLWVAGANSVSLFPTDPAGLGTWTATKVVTLETTNCALPSGLGTDAVDPCCAAGSYNGGIAINKFNGHVYVSNECQIGKVRRCVLR